MPRPRKKKKDRWTRPGVDGYILPRGDRAWMHYSDHKQTTGLQFHPSQKEHALDMLERWVRNQKLERLGIDTGPRKTHTVADLVAKFVELRMQDAGTSMRAGVSTAIKHFLHPISKMRVDKTDDIASALNRMIRAPGRQKKDRLSARTINAYLQHVRSIFAFAIQLGWTTRNPLDIISIPAVEDTSGHPHIPFEEATAAISHAYAIDTEAAECLELILLTAMRQHEARGLRRGHLFDDYIDVRGKGAGRKPGETHTDWWKRKPQRIVPLYRAASEWKPSPVRGWQLQLTSLVDRIIARVGDDPGAYLFPTRSPGHSENPFFSATTLMGVFRAGLRAAGLDDSYVLHSLRKSTEYWFEATLHLDPFDFCDITGHDVATYVKAYRQRRTAGDLVSSIARSAGLDSPDDCAKPAIIIDRTHPHTRPR